ncbi:small toxic polypeptide ldrD [Escherichia coli]|nr:small toxic polypeptide ldrD [Escherichia coli]PPV71701.1 small toxic polypeptide ldrD [Escherichia coli]
MHLTTSRGLILNLNNSRIAAKRCHYNRGGYMTLAELGMAFWHDLAAPVIAGILASLIVNWLNKRK